MGMDLYVSNLGWCPGVYKNEIVQAGVSNRMRQCFNFLVLNVHIPTYLGLRGKPFLKLLSFFGVSADRR